MLAVVLTVSQPTSVQIGEASMCPTSAAAIFVSRQAVTVRSKTSENCSSLEIRKNSPIFLVCSSLFGGRTGTRTLDPLIKSQVLLACRPPSCVDKNIIYLLINNMLCRHPSPIAYDATSGIARKVFANCLPEW